MSAITLENDLVHYEVLGRGRPVIFVHGWLGSWRYWVPAMQQLSAKYRTYALDLWGFGDSGRNAKNYDFKDQVELLHEFMEKLGITKAALVGHSLGAAICLRYASLYPDRAPRLALISAPLFDLGGLDDALTVDNAAKPATSAAVMPAVANNAGSSPVEVTSSANAASATTTNPATTPAAQPAVPVSATPNAASAANPNTETIPRNPFRGLGETPEEILARLQAKNVVSSAGIGAPAPSTAPAPTPSPDVPKPPVAPTLPTGIATPILPQTGPLTPVNSTTPVPSPVIPSASPTRIEVANPLLKILTGKPIDAFNKYIDHNAIDRDKLKPEVEKADEAALTKSVQSFNGINLSLELRRLTIPTLLLHGKLDPMLPAPSEELLDRIGKGKAAGHLITFLEDDLHHYPMLELGAKFNRLLQDFLDTADLTNLNIQFKEQWRRTMR